MWSRFGYWPTGLRRSRQRRQERLIIPRTSLRTRTSPHKPWKHAESSRIALARFWNEAGRSNLRKNMPSSWGRLAIWLLNLATNCSTQSTGGIRHLCQTIFGATYREALPAASAQLQRRAGTVRLRTWAVSCQLSPSDEHSARLDCHGVHVKGDCPSEAFPMWSRLSVSVWSRHLDPPIAG